MEKLPTINELCRNRLIPIPEADEATREARIAIMVGNQAVMREEMGKVSPFYPQTAEEVPAWLDKHDTLGRNLKEALRLLGKLPPDAEIPAPFGW